MALVVSKWAFSHVMNQRKSQFCQRVNTSPQSCRKQKLYRGVTWSHNWLWILNFSKLQSDCEIFVSYDFPKNWLNIIQQPSTIFHILRPKSANQTLLSPSGLKQRQSWLVSYYECYDRYLQYIHCSDMCCLYIFKWPWLHQPIIVFISPMAKYDRAKITKITGMTKFAK